MKGEKDFILDDDPVTFTIDGNKFAYRPTTTEQELNWSNEYLEWDEEQNQYRQNMESLNKLKLKNLLKVPYSKTLIKKITGIDKDWEEMDCEEKHEVFKKMRPQTYNKIMQNIREIDSPTQKKS